MITFRTNRVLIALFVALSAACAKEKPSSVQSVDVLITGGVVYSGAEGDDGALLDVGITGDRIAFVGDAQSETVSAKTTVNAEGLIIAPGFIDPHTHSMDDLLSETHNVNANYLRQGVTTVVVGVDGGGPVNIAETLENFAQNGIGTNAALFVGHNTLRKLAIGEADRAPTSQELDSMRSLVSDAMAEGALGLSTGLYYAPGSFAKTEEIIELAKVAAEQGGVYDSHIRDESSYSIGLLTAISEALEIGKRSGAPVHIAHIKALGVDVWGKSKAVIDLVEAARREGQQVTADQYPWAASGTSVSNALIPNWAKAGGLEDLHMRLQDAALQSRLHSEIKENLRKRGGAGALLITEGNEAWVGKTLSDISSAMNMSPVESAITIVLQGDARVASFNMQESDIEAFMREPWVITSSDGSKGHPRKYGSFPRKFRHYVVDKDVISVGEFIRRSTGLAADILNLCDRGYIREGFAADITIFDPKTFRENADFLNPERSSSGVFHLFVNGVSVIENGKLNYSTAGKPLRRGRCN